MLAIEKDQDMSTDINSQINKFFENVIKNMDPSFYEGVVEDFYSDELTVGDKVYILLERLKVTELYFIRQVKANCVGTEPFDNETVKNALFCISLVFFAKLSIIHFKDKDNLYFTQEKIDTYKNTTQSYIQQIIIGVQKAIQDKIKNPNEKAEAEKNLEAFTDRLDNILSDFE